MNVLITGGAGNLGSRLVVPLVRRADLVTLFDVSHQPLVKTPEFQQATFIEGDLADGRAVLSAVRDQEIESIFHLGAVLSGNAEEQPETAWKANLEGTRNILEAARKYSVDRVVFSSTLATYGAGLPNPLPIDAPQWPITLYGATKVAGERLGVYYHHRFGLDFRAIRFPAVIAPKGATGGASAFCSAVFEESVRYGRYEFYLNPSTRCPVLYINDAVRALIELHDAPPDRLRRHVYNVAGLGPSAEELAAAVRERLPEVDITYRPDPLLTVIVESWPFNVDDSDARHDWGWKSTYDLNRMAHDVIAELQHELEKE